jgi:hypothetical protein
MSRDEVLDGLLELEARSARLLHMEPPAVGGGWEDLEVRLGLDPLPHSLGLRGQDHFVSVFAGLAGGLLDLRPQIADSLTNEEMHQRIDAAFKEKAREVTGKNGTIAIDNAIGGPDHRLVGPTHDLFRLFKTIQLVRRGEFESAVKGVLKFKTSYRDGLPPYLKVDKASDALVLVLMHWAADFFSSRSLPIPGWSKLAEIDDRDFVAWLFKAYREGANLRTVVSQFLSNLSGLALISIILHIYRYIDLFWITEKAEFSAARLRLNKDLRFRWMSRNANLTALGVTTGNALITQNIFNWNYMAMMKFFADARAVEGILDAHHAELDRRTDLLLIEVEAY